MTILHKILITLGVLALFGAVAFIIYNQSKLAQQQTAIQTQIVAQQQLVDGIARSASQYTTKQDLEKFAQDSNINLQTIQDNLKKLNAQVSSVNVVTTSSTGQTSTNVASTSTGPANPTAPTPSSHIIKCPNGGSVTCPDDDPHGYQKAEQVLALNEDFATIKVPIGSVGFSAWQAAPWNINIAPREYDVDTVVGVDENNRQYFYNKFTVKVNNKSYEVPIKTATTKQEYPTAKFSFWNPRLLLGLDAGVNLSHFAGEFSPSLNVGIMSYGQYKTTPDLSVLEIGAAYEVVNKKPALMITPVAYNFGKALFSPFINNTYIAPALQIGVDGSFAATVGLRVGF
jgi:hypothetical protein